MSVEMNLTILNLDKGQDFGVHGKGTTIKGEEFIWMVGCDGHGADYVVNILRGMNWGFIMSQDDSLKLVIDIIDSSWTKYPERKYVSSGATYMEAKIFKDRIETCSVGDSKIMVFMDDKLCYKSTEHNFFNPLEKERLIDYDITLSTTVAPQVLTPTNITGTIKYYHTFENGTMLAMTQSLGHNHVTGIDAERKVIPYNSQNKMRVVLMSDGLSELLSTEPVYHEQDLHSLAHLSSDQLASIAEQRWKQDWDYYAKKEDELFTPYCFRTKPHSKRSGFDDVLVLTCDILPVQEDVKEAVVQEEPQKEEPQEEPQKEEPQEKPQKEAEEK
jgi:serine/threonine protein phosphatase PrpC